MDNWIQIASINDADVIDTIDSFIEVLSNMGILVWSDDSQAKKDGVDMHLNLEKRLSND